MPGSTSVSPPPVDEQPAPTSKPAPENGAASLRAQTPSRLLAATAPPNVEDNVTDADLRHRSRMTPRFGLMMALLARAFFKPVKFPTRINNALTDCAREGVPVYVMRTASLLDYLYFNYAFRRAGLPLAEFANGLDTTFFQPWRTALRLFFRRYFGKTEGPADSVIVQGLVRRRRSVLLFLRRGFSFAQLVAPRRQQPHLRDLIAAQRHTDFPVFVVPQMLVWERKLDRGRSNILETFFGDPQAPGVLRKALSFAVNHRRAFVRLGERINVREFLDEHDVGMDDSLLAERLRLLIEQRFKSEDRVMRGVPVPPPAVVAKAILDDANFDAKLQEIADDEKRSIDDVREEARANLMEIAADLKLWMVDLFSLALTLIWARIYEGIEIDYEGLEKVKQAGRDRPVVVVPSHKSHIDYLVISYVFHNNGIVPPHIAAGANLNFWPIGPMFRKAGAFFLRRTFKGQPVYAASFRAYLRKQLRDGHVLEFFPEGTRSRTGKLLPPKYGMLTQILAAVADGDVEDVKLAPVNFGYERLIEEGAYRKELEGGEKRAESGLEMLRATQVLVHKYGRMRIQFAEPLSVRELLADAGALTPLHQRDEKAWARAVKIAGYTILHGINEAAVVTTTSLVAAVLLMNEHRGIGRDDLVTRIGYLLDTCQQHGAVLSDPLRTAMQTQRKKLLDASTQDAINLRESGGFPDPLGNQGERARAIGSAVEPLVEATLADFVGPRWITRKQYGSDEVYVVKRVGRLHLDYYKNNIIHLLVEDALLAAAALAELDDSDSFSPADLEESTRFLSLLLKFEFVYDPQRGFARSYGETQQRWRDKHWLTETDNGRLRIRHKVMPVVRMYGKLLHNFIESYMVMGRALTVLRDGAMTEKEFLDHCQTEADKLSEIGYVRCYEAISKVNLLNALAIFVEEQYIQRRTEVEGKKRIKMLQVRIGSSTSAQFATFVKRIETFHEPWRV